ncbi:MAG TPA: MFS transporter [Thermomonospora sp.]|nr:MFS transporter [Thermomonospora sp.]
MLPGPGLRSARAVFFGAVCVVVSAGVHLYAGGAPVPPAVMALATALTSGGAYALAGRERTLRTLLPAAFAAQFGLHQLFSWGAGHTAPAPPDPATAAAGHVHDAGSLPMLIAHLTVALITAAWLERGEAALCAFLRGLYAGAVSLLALLLPDPPVPPRPVAAPRPVALPPTRRLRAAIVRRGPPVPISS